MPFQVSPGVNVSEIDLTTVVPAVSSTEGAIAGQFRWGPADKAILVDSEDRLVNIFQKPTSNNADDFFTAANFLSYGNALNVVRVTGAGAKNAANTTAVLIANEDSTVPSADDTFIAKYAGELGNSLKVSVCASANAFTTTTDIEYSVSRNSSSVTVATANTASVTGAVSVGDLLHLGANREETIKVAGVATTNSTIVTISLEKNYTGVDVSANSTNVLKRSWEYSQIVDGAPGTSVNGAAKGAKDDEIHVAIVDSKGEFTGVRGTVLEMYEGVSLGSDTKDEQGSTLNFKNVINSQSQYVVVSAKQLLTSNTNLADNDFHSAASESVISKQFVGGADGADVLAAQKILGYDKFASAEDIDVSLILGGNADATLATHLINNIAESRKDCIVVLSPQRGDVVNNNSYAGKERDDIIAFRDSLPSSSYAVMDSGWKYQYDKYNDVYRYVPLNADTAGLMVQTDLTRDPWFSPAGYNRGNVKNVIKLAYNPSKGDRDALYKKGVNPVVTFPGQGTVLFGDKTLLAKPSAFDRINVRRLFIVLEKAISTASQFTLFEFNDEFTRSQFTNLVVPFLRDVQGRRGITDFQVVCDGTNNTGEVIDRNEFIGDIYIKPARSINFIQLNFVAVRSGVEFSEIVGRA